MSGDTGQYHVLNVACDPGVDYCAFASYDTSKEKWDVWKIDLPENFGAKAATIRASLEGRGVGCQLKLFVAEGQYAGPNARNTIRLSKIATLVQSQALDAGFSMLVRPGLKEDGELPASTWQAFIGAAGQKKRPERKALAMGHARRLLGYELNDQDIADAVCMVDWMMNHGCD